MNAGDIVARAAWILNDADHTRWSEAMLLSFIGEAQGQVALVRPDATARTQVLALGAGTGQRLPEDGLRLLDVCRNLGPDGNTPGRAVQRADREALDACMPDWRSDALGGEARLWVHDERQPKVFQIWPGRAADGPWHVEIAYSAATQTPGTINDRLALDDCFAGPVLDYVLHRAFAVDGGSGAGRERSAAHLEAFARGLNAKLSGDMLVTGAVGRAGLAETPRSAS